MKYIYRKALWTTKKEFLLTENALQITNLKTNRVETVPFDEIQKVNLMRIPAAKGVPVQYICTISVKGKKKIELANRSIKGFADFIDKSDEYREFVSELNQKLCVYTEVQFQKGKSRAYQYAVWGFAILALFAFVGLATALFQEGKIGEGIMMGLAALLVLYYAVKFSKAYKPDVYNPKEIDKNLLP